MTGLSCLKKLLLSDCRELMFLPPLPSSLEELNLENCVAVQYIHDISNLERLKEFNLTNCEKVVDVPGLEHLKSLRRLYMSGCIGCSLAVKRRFSKVLLKKLEILIMPRSRVPDWLTAECFPREEIGSSKVLLTKLIYTRLPSHSHVLTSHSHVLTFPRHVANFSIPCQLAR
ncbi:uncharacterized protein LOC124845182 [Vigna umbellata]|uniref:uncharacterized protein LOC124845182 n=1 Tax=Vigna umbellata TaxID=87088 RepID=UPI001F5F8D44|nr:uncharacterized protein LOC124845182 [Vigna umbellata]